MRVDELFEGVMSLSEVDLLWREVRALPRATASIHMGEGTVTVRFEIDGEKGWLKLKADPKKFRDAVEQNQRRAIAAARTQLGGRAPKDWTVVKNTLANGVSNRALNILTSPEFYELVGASFGRINYGFQPAQS